ncbi:serine/threonine-protein kinase [Paraliomyxa miuraensis]|uniref:serine/threonine-protein kinase n=1 Tax=Paraliomyxa miuraensis TaxID=376150 RepID=UPI00224EFB4E|nr:serine/threonine-protein kinase [Paraliomyxa miuraensis]MCX4245236.1 serine/threonine-protein kinase [Paraliomyxa miuraensis]
MQSSIPTIASDEPLDHARAAPTEPMAPPWSELPQQVGRYVMLGRIGEGGMGVVLRALDPELDREVAIKLLHARRHDRTDGTPRLLREAQALAKLSHPNVIDVYDVGMSDDRVFIAMAFVAGGSLHTWLCQERPLPEILDAFAQAGQGLLAAHRAGLVHRDFKPANVLRSDNGRILVADFGLAAPIRGDEEQPTLQSDEGQGHILDMRMTATGHAVGTPGYMAPEAYAGGPLDARSDQWSFCASLYEALYGARPYPGGSVFELMQQVRRGPPQPPDDPRVPAALRELVVRGLSVAPEDRWPSMAEIIERLRPPRPRSRRWLGAAITSTAAAAAGLWLALAPDAGPACEQAAEAVEGVWNDSVRATVHEAFVRSGMPYVEQTLRGLDRSLDEHALALADARQRACEDGRHGDARGPQHDRRLTCLGRRLSELRGTVEELAHADADTVRNAVQAVGALRSPSECEAEAAVATTPPPPPSIAADVERVHDDIARALAMKRSGHYDRALAQAELARATATALGHAPLTAEAQQLYGSMLMADGDYDAARRELVEAWHQAQAVGDDPLAARASIQLVSLEGVHLRRPDDAERWARHARAAIERLADPTDTRTFLEGTLGNLRRASGEPERAREHYERALASTIARSSPLHPEALDMRGNLALIHHDLGDHARARAQLTELLSDRIAVYGPGHPEVSATLGNLGVVEQMLGELPASAEHTQQALDGLRASVGLEHPLYPQLLTNLANTTYLMGRFEQALRMHQQAKELLERSLGPQAFLVGRSLMNMGPLLHRLERRDEARATYARAREIFEEHLRPDHPELGILLGNLAEVDRDSGQLHEALAGFDRAIEILEQALGPQHPELAYTLAGRGQTHTLMGHPARGTADLQRAVTLLETAGLDPESLISMRILLAQARWDDGARDEGLRLLERARDEAQRLGERGAPLVDQIEAWHADHASAPAR